MTQVRIKRGAAANLSFVPLDGEPIWTNDYTEPSGGKLWIGNGTNIRGVQVGWPFAPTPGWKSGYYYFPSITASAFTTSTVSVNAVVYYPIHIGGGVNSTNGASYQSFHFEVTTAQAGTNAVMGIYDSKAGEPNDLLFESGNISCATTGVKTWSISRTLQGGWYWIAMNTDANTAVFRCFDNLTVPSGAIGHSSSAFTLHNVLVELATFAVDPLPSTATVLLSATADVPAVSVRAA